MTITDETTANALAFAWYLLATHPEVDARLWEELENVVGDREPTYAGVPQLRYTRMVFEETLRLYPPAYALSREALRESGCLGCLAPAGQMGANATLAL